MQRTLIGLTLATLLLSGCGKESPDALLDSADAYLAKGDAKAALIQVRNALQQSPELARARLMHGRLLLEGGDPKGAEVELRKARQLNAPADELAPLLVRALVTQGKFKEALEAFPDVQLTDPKARAAYQLGIAHAHAGLGRGVEAREAVKAALAEQPDLLPALLIDARMAAADGDVEGAFERLERAQNIAPQHADVHKLRGDLLLFGRDQPEDALAAYRQAIELDPGHLESHLAAVNLLSRGGRLDEAKQQLEGVKARFPKHPQVRLTEAQLALQTRDHARARELVQDLVRLAPDNVAVLQLAGMSELLGGSLVQAETHLAKAVQLAPRNDTARKGLAQVYLRTGQSEKAVATLAPVLEGGRPDPQALALAGQAHMQQGDTQQAMKYFEQAARQNPEDVRSRTMLAMADISRGRSEAGLQALEALASDDEGATADLALIAAHVSRKEYDRALKAIDALERKFPDRPDAAVMRARVQVLQRDLGAARASFERALQKRANYLPAVSGLAGLDLADGKPEAARQRFEQLVEAEPGNVRARLALAELRARTGASRDEVGAVLSEAVQRAPADVAARRAWVEFHLRGGDARQALKVAQDAVAAVPDQPVLLEALGRAQLQVGEHEQALASFSKAAVLRPGSPEPHLLIAETRMRTGKPEAAREALNKALQLQADYLPAQQALLTLEISQKRHDAALKVAQDIQRQRPKQALGDALVGDIEMSRGQPERAVAAYRSALGKASESPDLAQKLHNALGRAGKGAEADRFAATWVKDHPKDSQFLVYLGGLELAKGQLASAEQRYAQAVKARPDDPIAQNNLAWVLSRQGKPGALEAAEKANTLRPNQPPFMDTLASVLAADKQFDRAIETQKKVVAMQPQQPFWRLNLAKILIQAGRRVEAESELKELEKLGDKFPAHAEVKALLQGQ